MCVCVCVRARASLSRYGCVSSGEQQGARWLKCIHMMLMLLLSIKCRRYLGARCSSGFPIWSHESATTRRAKEFHLSLSGGGRETRRRSRERGGRYTAFCLQTRTQSSVRLGNPQWAHFNNVWAEGCEGGGDLISKAIKAHFYFYLWLNIRWETGRSL